MASKRPAPEEEPLDPDEDQNSPKAAKLSENSSDNDSSSSSSGDSSSSDSSSSSGEDSSGEDEGEVDNEVGPGEQLNGGGQVEFAPQQQQEEHQLGLDPAHLSVDLSDGNENDAESVSFPMEAPDEEELLQFDNGVGDDEDNGVGDDEDDVLMGAAADGYVNDSFDQHRKLGGIVFQFSATNSGFSTSSRHGAGIAADTDGSGARVAVTTGGSGAAAAASTASSSGRARVRCLATSASFGR
jgi:hypothetical protein